MWTAIGAGNQDELLFHFEQLAVYLFYYNYLQQFQRQHMFNFFANHTVLEGDYRIQDIKVQEQLGRGNAHVYTASIKGQTFALKQIEIKNDYEYQNFLKQISNMQQISLKSEWIVKYNGYLVTKMQRNQYDIKKYAYIIMQCAEENLQQFFTQRKDFKYRLKVNELIVIVDQILTALASLEEIHRAHCDIKPENILIMNSKTYAIKLCDVGSSKVVSKESLEEATILGTVPFLAPELLKVQGSKVVGNRAFKSDVFSFGLVVLYLITQKKFKSQQRLQIDEQTYREVIGEWIKYARQLCDDETSIGQILKGALQFDEFRRPMFKDLKFTYFNERKKKAILNKTFVQRLEKEQQMKISRLQQTSTYFSSQPSNQINLFKTRRVQRINFTKTISNGVNFKISKSRNSPSPVKRTNSLASNSPQKTQKSVGIGSMHDLLSQMKKVIYIGQQTKNYLPQVIDHQQEKNFILGIPEVRFKKAQTITILPSCTYDVFDAIELVQCKRLYLQTMEKETLGVPLDASILKFSKIRINLSRCQMIGGFDGLFRIITGAQLQLLEIRLADTEVSTKEINYLLDRLIQCPRIQTLLLSFERKLITEEQHQMITQKVAKMPLKKLSLLMNECYIQYEKSARWALPKTVQVLYLDYGNNLLQSVIDNLSLSLNHSKQLKQLTVSLENNALNKKDVNALIKAIAGLQNLQRLALNLSYNKIEEVKYLQSTLSLLKGINYLQVKLHKTEIDTQRILQLIDYLKEELFVINFNLKMMKITCNRNKSLHLMRQHLNKICTIEGQNKNKSLRCQVVGFDNLYYMIYIKKNDKLHSNRAKGGAAIKKSPKLQNLPKMTTTMSEGITLSNFNSAPKQSNLCYQLYTSSDSFHNFLCLTCCQSKELNKNMFYCKFCVSNCLTDSKDHYFVKVTEATRCVCAYSGKCKSDTKAVVCSDKMGVPLKKQYQCLRCEASYCMVCIQLCKDSHKDWVRQCKQLSYFKCRSKITIKQ